MFEHGSAIRSEQQNAPLTCKLHKQITSTWSLRLEVLDVVNFAVDHRPHTAVLVVVLQISFSDQSHILTARPLLRLIWLHCEEFQQN